MSGCRILGCTNPVDGGLMCDEHTEGARNHNSEPLGICRFKGCYKPANNMDTKTWCEEHEAMVVEHIDIVAGDHEEEAKQEAMRYLEEDAGMVIRHYHVGDVKPAGKDRVLWVPTGDASSDARTVCRIRVDEVPKGDDGGLVFLTNIEMDGICKVDVVTTVVASLLQDIPSELLADAQVALLTEAMKRLRITRGEALVPTGID